VQYGVLVRCPDGCAAGIVVGDGRRAAEDLDAVVLDFAAFRQANRPQTAISAQAEPGIRKADSGRRRRLYKQRVLAFLEQYAVEDLPGLIPSSVPVEVDTGIVSTYHESRNDYGRFDDGIEWHSKLHAVFVIFHVVIVTEGVKRGLPVEFYVNQRSQSQGIVA